MADENKSQGSIAGIRKAIAETIGIAAGIAGLAIALPNLGEHGWLLFVYIVGSMISGICFFYMVRRLIQAPWLLSDPGLFFAYGGGATMFLLGFLFYLIELRVRLAKPVSDAWLGTYWQLVSFFLFAVGWIGLFLASINYRLQELERRQK